MTPGQLRGIVCVEGYGAFQGTVRSRLDGVVGKENGAMTYVKESPIAPTTFMSLGRRRCTEVAAVVLRGGITQVRRDKPWRWRAPRGAPAAQEGGGTFRGGALAAGRAIKSGLAWSKVVADAGALGSTSCLRWRYITVLLMGRAPLRWTPYRC